MLPLFCHYITIVEIILFYSPHIYIFYRGCGVAGQYLVGLTDSTLAVTLATVMFSNKYDECMGHFHLLLCLLEHMNRGMIYLRIEC